MARPLDALVRTYAAPVLKSDGWSASGRVFRLTSPEGDAARLSFSESKLSLGDGLVRFVISAQLGPAPLVRFLRRDDTAAEASRQPQQHHMFQLGWFPFDPPETLRAAWSPAVWMFSPESQAEICGAALAEVIRLGSPWLGRMLDPEQLLAAVLDRSVFGLGLNEDHPAASRLLCLMDRLPSEEVEQLVAQVPDEGPYLPRVRRFVLAELSSRS